MSVDVLRWHRSAYETDADLARERADAEALGLRWELWPDVTPPPRLAQARALVVTSGVRVTDDILAVWGGELLICTTSGFDHVDVDAACRRGIAVARCPLARRDAVVERTLGALLHLLHRVDPQTREAAVGRWSRGALPELAPRTLAGARVVVVGLGIIGTQVASLLTALGASVTGVDPYARPGGPRLDDVLEGADAITLHCALSPSARGLLSAERLARLPRHAVVVNTARGESLDVQAAVDMVAQARLGGLAVDVFPIEPYPDLAVGAATPGVLFTPHSAGFTHDLGARVARGVQDALRAWSRGEPLPFYVGETPAGW
ncbi:MAG: hypothetical protein RLZZ383_188 [Pseudomonadota bacterium]|jgi:phosphoglycerate dehydrogenase-like enzyme